MSTWEGTRRVGDGRIVADPREKVDRRLEAGFCFFLKIWGEAHAPLGPREVRVILESCLHASTFLITASSSPDMCLCPS